MALAVHAAVMGHNGEPVVHPFFTASREADHSKAIVPENLSDDELASARPQPRIQISPNNNIYALNDMAPSKDKPRKVGRPKKGSKKDAQPEPHQLQLVPTTAASQPGQALLQKPALPEQTAPTDLEVEGTIDADESRRKRRRVTPGDEHRSIQVDAQRQAVRGDPSVSKQATAQSTTDLEDQMIYAGSTYGSPLPPHHRDDLSRSAGMALSEQPPYDLVDFMAIDEGIPNSGSQGAHTSHTDLHAQVTQSTAPAQAKTPPKKMLMLRTDGKLKSPKAAPEGVKKSRRKKKSAGDVEAQRVSLVRVLYGSDEDTRQALGKRIEDILSGATSVKPAQQAVEVRNLPPKPVGPPKPTHPFFRKPAAQVVTDVPAHATSSTTNTSRPVSSKESPTKQKASVPSSWAGFGSTFSKPSKFPGAVGPLWPPKGMLHIRGLPEQHVPIDESIFEPAPERKLKASVVTIGSDEEVLRPYRDLVHAYRIRELSQTALFTKPKRRLMTGPELQSAVRDRTYIRLPDKPDALIERLANPQLLQPSDMLHAHHPAVLGLYARLRTSLSPFDRFECDNLDWVHKYAPTCATDVLQPTGDASLLLRDWLVNLTVTSVGGSKPSANTQLTAEMIRKIRAKAKRKRKRNNELDDFLVSDEGSDQTDELTEPEDLSPGDAVTALPSLTNSSLSRTKAVIISGPHGVGKTATVYAVAQELGFEVFEINSGSRRSGKDLLDKVGDMAKNHLVRQKSQPEDSTTDKEQDDTELQADIESGRQQTMGSFFKTGSKTAKSNAKQDAKRQPESTKKPSNQRQSLILLEEVDVLFEEDKLFWSTVLTLLFNSRRPIVMTCREESLLPLQDLSHCRALRLANALPEVATDYLLMLAANEGHLLSRDVVTKLLDSVYCDLREAITHLNFYCQMALGDNKAGLEWMLVRSSKQESHNDNGEPLRVVSEGTFTQHMAMVPQVREPVSIEDLSTDITFLADAAREHRYDVENWSEFRKPTSHDNSLETLAAFELGCDAMSAADIMPGSDFFQPLTGHMDASQDALPEAAMANCPIGHTTLHAVHTHEQDRFSLEIVLALKLLSRSIAFSNPGSTNNDDASSDADDSDCDALDPPHIAEKIVTAPPSCREEWWDSARSIYSTLHPLSQPAANTIIGNKGPAITITEHTIPTLATDVAPYVRSIVASDIKLEHERLRLSGLLSQGGLLGKKQRTTRASRAALEGGRKESTRRERWFSKELSLQRVMGTGPGAWRKALRRWTEGEEKKLAEKYGGIRGAIDDDDDDEADGPEGASVEASQESDMGG